MVKKDRRTESDERNAEWKEIELISLHVTETEQLLQSEDSKNRNGYAKPQGEVSQRGSEKN